MPSVLPWASSQTRRASSATRTNSSALNRTSTRRITTPRHPCHLQLSSIRHLRVTPQPARQLLSNSRRQAAPGVEIPPMQASKLLHTISPSPLRLLASQRKLMQQVPLKRPQASSKCDKWKQSQVMNTVKSLFSLRHAHRKKLRREVVSQRIKSSRRHRRKQRLRRQRRRNLRRRPT